MEKHFFCEKITDFKKHVKTSSLASPIQNQIDKNENYNVIIRDNVTNPKDSDIFLKNTYSGKEEFFMTISEVYKDHFHNSEFHRGNLYIIRRIGYTGIGNNTWKDELWKYDEKRNGLKLFSGQGFSFLVSPDNTKIALEVDGDLKLFNSSGQLIKNYSGYGGQLIESENKWSSDGKIFWGCLTLGPIPQKFYKIDTSTLQIDNFDVNNLNMGQSYELDLNADKGLVIYSDYPVMFDVDSSNRFAASGKTVNLFLYNFLTKEKQLIATSIAKRFNPKWINNTEFEYTNRVKLY